MHPCPRCQKPLRFVDQYQQWWCDTCQAYAGAAPPRPMTEAERAQAESAKTLVMWSHILGWGGVGTFLLLGPVVAVGVHGIAGLTLSGAGLIAAVVGAILGQVGRAQQGRVI